MANAPAEAHVGPIAHPREASSRPLEDDVIREDDDHEEKELLAHTTAPKIFGFRLPNALSFPDFFDALFGYRNVVGRKKDRPRYLKTAVLKHARVRLAIEQYSKERSVPLKMAEQHAKQLVDEMCSDFTARTFRFMKYIVTKMLNRMYQEVYVDLHGIEKIRSLIQAGQPVVLVPTHKSHVDYLIISVILFKYNLSLPYIAAGENLNIPLVGTLLKRSGAFFIKRQFDSDPLYRAIFTSYIELMLLEKCVVEFFIEGGRSRSGKVMPPKMGMLSVVVDSVLQGTVPEVMIVPISVNYDKVPEDSSHAKELKGSRKQKESLSGLLSSYRVLRLKLGRIDVTIANPISLKRYIDEQIAMRRGPDQSLRYDPYTVAQDRRRLIHSLAYRILYDCNRVSFAMPTALVASVLLTAPGHAVSLSDLVAKVEWLKNQIISRGGHVSWIQVATARRGGSRNGPVTEDGNTRVLVQRTVKVLGPLIQVHKKLVQEPMYEPKKRLELTYYKNQICHWFVAEAVIACALYALSPKLSLGAAAATPQMGVGRRELLESVTFISQLLKREFIYQPSPDIAENFGLSLQRMVQRGILQVKEPTDSSDAPNVRVQLVPSPQAYSTFLFMCSLLWPFLDGYWVAAKTLADIWPDLLITDGDFLTRAQRAAVADYYQGKIRFYEAVSKEPLQNAINLFHEWGIIVTQRIVDTKLSTIKLAKAYAEDKDKLIALCDKIGKYRSDTWQHLLTGPQLDDKPLRARL